MATTAYKPVFLGAVVLHMVLYGQFWKIKEIFNYAICRI